MNRRFWDSTLNLPKTSLPLRYKAADDSLYRQSVCESLYSALQSRQDTGSFQLIDGPPFANGNLHVGHALNKILKDVILRHRALKGEKIVFRPGWDCHGLPIEMKALSSSQMNSDPLAIRALCRKFALGAVEAQAEVMKQWGLLVDYENPYLTMNPEFEANQLQVLAAMLEKKLIFSARKPVYFSPSSKTALAEAELEYDDNHVSLAAFVKFKAHLDQSLLNRHQVGPASVYFVAWTTTPWTLPSNKALAVGKDLVYSLVKNGNEFFIVAKDCVGALCAQMQHSLHVVKADFCLGSDIAAACKYEKLSFSFEARASELGPVLAADFVTADSGTGIVHLAPDHGREDYEACKAIGISPDCDFLNDQGDFNNSAPSFLRGMNVSTGANETILEYLKCAGAFLSSAYHKHRYPIDWRTKAPVIQRATQQWFVSISELIDQLKAALEAVTFVPDSGKQKMLNMLQSRTEWCISRQRHWGLPIPAFKSGDELILRPDWVKHFAELVRSDASGSDIWWKRPAAELIPNSSNSSASLEKTFNTLDVWFDSGTVWTNFRDDCKETIYLEGSDQFRGWFQSSLITSVAVRGKSPFTKIISHGFVLDQDGHKMSKSLGNVVDPQDIVKAEGADVLRLWAASTNYTADVSIGTEILSQITESRRKLRNTLRFIVANLDGYDGRAIDWTQLRTIDKLAFGKLATIVEECKTSYEAHEYQKVTNTLSSFCSDDLSSFYLDTLKDRLYTEAVSSPLRQTTQALLKVIAQSLVSLLNPITPFLSQEVASQLGINDFALPNFEEVEFDASRYEALVSMRNSFMEFYRSTLRTRFDCKSTFSLDVSVSGECGLDEIELAELLQVAQVRKSNATHSSDSAVLQIGPDLKLQVSRSNRHKCPRCWTFNSASEEIPCPKCQEQLLQIPIPLPTLQNINKQLDSA